MLWAYYWQWHAWWYLFVTAITGAVCQLLALRKPSLVFSDARLWKTTWRIFNNPYWWWPIDFVVLHVTSKNLPCLKMYLEATPEMKANLHFKKLFLPSVKSSNLTLVFSFTASAVLPLLYKCIFILKYYFYILFLPATICLNPQRDEQLKLLLLGLTDLSIFTHWITHSGRSFNS